MRKYLAVVALGATLAQPASAVEFPSLTTIYVGAGAEDSGDVSNVAATIFQCSIVSGAAAQIRIVVLSSEGFVIGLGVQTIPHGGGRAFSTHATTHFGEDAFMTPSILFSRGTVNIESTNSAVFCTAMIVDAAATEPSGIELHLVRVNSHHGTVE